MKKTLVSAILLCTVFAGPSFAQTVSDVLRYSALNPGGTARFTGVGGAFTALGAEFGAISQNPAGLAMFRSSELIVTPSMRFNKISAGLSDESVFSETGSRFGFDNFGMVFHSTPHRKGTKWTTFNVGIGMNRQANFGQALFYEGSAKGTIMNDFFQDAQTTLNNGGTLDDLYPFTSGLAWDANAIYEDVDNNLSYDFLNTPNATIQRSHAVNTFGRMNEMALSIAGNYDERLMVGAALGVPFVNYRIEGEYIETDPKDSVEYFDKLTYTEYLRTQGFGVNAKLGLIYRVNQMFRVGASVHTPTMMGLTDTYNNTLQYGYTDGNGPVSGDVQESPEGSTDYRLVTPWRVNAGIAVVAKKTGFVSADIELVDYGNNRYNLDANVPNAGAARDERDLNNAVQRAYKQTMNFRLGGEIALETLRLRAGMNLLGKPGVDDTGFTTAYTAGIGIRQESFYVDLGYRRTQRNSTTTPYNNAPAANTNVVNNDVLLTLGFKF